MADEDYVQVPILGNKEKCVDIFDPRAKWVVLCSTGARRNQEGPPVIVLVVGVNKAELYGHVPTEQFAEILAAMADNLIRNSGVALCGGTPNR